MIRIAASSPKSVPAWHEVFTRMAPAIETHV